MAEAREMMDRVTEAVLAGNLDELRACYASDATMWAPDAGDLSGADAILGYMRTQADAFPDATFEFVAKHEAGDVAIDEGYFVATNTGPLEMPSGETFPATGKRVRLRACDVATVKNGRITRHHLYYDQMAFAEQLGLTQ